MNKEYRPANWINPYKVNWPDNDRIIFEHGASVMLEAVVTHIEKRIDDGEVHFNGLIYNILAELKGEK